MERATLFSAPIEGVDRCARHATLDTRIRLVGGPPTAVESFVDPVAARIQSVPAGLKLPLLLAPLMSSVLIA